MTPFTCVFWKPFVSAILGLELRDHVSDVFLHADANKDLRRHAGCELGQDAGALLLGELGNPSVSHAGASGHASKKVHRLEPLQRAATEPRHRTCFDCISNMEFD